MFSVRASINAAKHKPQTQMIQQQRLILPTAVRPVSMSGRRTCYSDQRSIIYIFLLACTNLFNGSLDVPLTLDFYKPRQKFIFHHIIIIAYIHTFNRLHRAHVNTQLQYQIIRGRIEKSELTTKQERQRDISHYNYNYTSGETLERFFVSLLVY